MQFETLHYEFLNNDTNSESNIKCKTKMDECITSIVKKEGYVTCDISKKTISTDGGNYLGVLYEIDVKGKTANGNKETAIFVKGMNIDSIDIGVLSLPDVYKTELFVYKELTKKFNELQDEANIPNDERYLTVKCYDESNEHAIILENITKKGFKTWYRMDVVTLNMAEVCIEQLARFHGMSFVLAQKRPDYFHRKIKVIQTALKFGDAWKGFLDKFYGIGMECLDVDLRSRVGKKVRSLLDKFQNYHENDSLRYCLCHGDYRPNNIMIKEVDGVVTEAVPVDYQLVFYGCPMLDFFYFIYMATDYKFRKAHMYHLKNLYYKSLERYLRHFDMSAELVLPRKVFENMYEEKLDYGLMISFLYCPFAFVSEEEIPDVTKETVSDIDFKFDDKFRLRLTDAIQEFIDLGYL